MLHVEIFVQATDLKLPAWEMEIHVVGVERVQVVDCGDLHADWTFVAVQDVDENRDCFPIHPETFGMCICGPRGNDPRYIIDGTRRLCALAGKRLVRGHIQQISSCLAPRLVPAAQELCTGNKRSVLRVRTARDLPVRYDRRWLRYL